jgi:hypothetical protein
VIDQDGPASYPDRPRILVTNNWLDCCKYAFAIYAASYFGICVFTNFSGEVPPNTVWKSSKLVIKIGSKAGPIRVSPAIPKVVTPTLCATKLKSTSEV